MNEGKKDRRDPIRTIKPKNPVAKNASAAIGGGAAGAHKDKKKAMKQGDVKHKKAEFAESYEDHLARRLEEATVNPQFINVQVTKILAREAQRMTNAPIEQLLAPLMKEYNLTLQQINSMVPGGLKKAAGEYGVMVKAQGVAEGFGKLTPQQKAHEYNLDSAQREMDRRHAEGEDMTGAKIDKKTYKIVKPKQQGVAEGGYDDPKIQFLQPTIQLAEKLGYRVTLNPQGRVVAKLVNKQLGHIVHIGLMQPSSKGFEVSMADNLDKQTNAWSAKELAQDFKGWYAQAVKDQDFNNGYNEKPQLEQQGVAEDADSWFRVTVKTPNGKNHNIQVPANSHGTAKRKALAYCAKNGIAGAEFVSAMRMPTLDEQGVAEGEGEIPADGTPEYDQFINRGGVNQKSPFDLGGADAYYGRQNDITQEYGFQKGSPEWDEYIQGYRDTYSNKDMRKDYGNDRASAVHPRRITKTPEARNGITGPGMMRDPAMEDSALTQHRKRGAQADADLAKREAARKKNPGAASGDRIKELEKRYPAKEGWTHDSLADRLFEHERTYEEKLQNQLDKLTKK